MNETNTTTNQKLKFFVKNNKIEVKNTKMNKIIIQPMSEYNHTYCYNFDGEIFNFYDLYYEDGTRIKEYDVKYPKNGIFKVYDNANNLVLMAEYKHSKRNGFYKTYYNNKLYLSGNCKNNKRNGFFYLYNKNSSIIQKENYKNGIWTSPVESYYDNGNIKTQTVFNSKNEPIIDYHYYKNGFLKSKFPRNGVGYTYFKNGNIKIKYRLKERIANGQVIEYYSNGKIKDIHYFRNNIQVSEKEYKTKKYPEDKIIIDFIITNRFKDKAILVRYKNYNIKSKIPFIIKKFNNDVDKIIKYTKKINLKIKSSDDLYNKISKNDVLDYIPTESFSEITNFLTKSLKEYKYEKK